MTSDKYKILHEIEDLLEIPRLYGLNNVRLDELTLIRNKIKKLNQEEKKHEKNKDIKSV
ncbi:MAG: hypothetical protein ACOC5T_08935 [Elusimicrobiota bacterium]